MVSVWSKSCWKLGFAGTLSLGVAVGGVDRVLAQTIPDNTLGAESSTVVPNVVIQGIVSDRIDGGAVRGINLFHSFLQFNVGNNQGVYFTNPNGVENILTRVTGGNPSAILGRLGVLGSANLFLLNPSGIVFGPNASLDVQGAFVASTASAIRLGNDRFSATEPEASTLLAVQPGTLFLDALAAINNQGNLAAGQSIRLQAGSINSTGQLLAPDVSVRAIAGDATVLSVAAQTASLSATGNLFAGNVAAGTANLVAGGNLAAQTVTAQTVSLLANNNLTAQNINATSAILVANQALAVQTVNAQTADLSAGTDLLAGTVNAQTARIAANNNLTVQSVTATSADLSAGNDLATQNVSAQTATLSAQNNLQLAGSQFNITGDLTLQAQNQVIISDNAANPLIVQVGGNLSIAGLQGIRIEALNNPGSLIQTGGSLSLVSNGAISTNAPLFIGGGFTIRAGGDIDLGDYTGSGLDFSTQGNITLGDVDTSSLTGNGGAVTLRTLGNGNITVRSIRSFSAAPGAGNGGAIRLTATGGNIALAGAIDTSAIAGNGGAVTLQAPAGNLTVRAIRAGSTAGNGGNVLLVANGGLTPGAIQTASTNGNGGTISLSSTSGAIDTTASRLDSSSIAGNAGQVSLVADRNLSTGAIAASSRDANGAAISLSSSQGAINTTAGELDSNSSLGDGGRVSLAASLDIATGTIDASSDNASGGSISLTSSNGAIDTTDGELYSLVNTVIGGSGGEVALQAANQIQVGTIRSDGGDRGSGGNIRLNSDRGGVTVIPNQEINSSTFGVGSAGDIGITGESLDLNGATVDASTSGAGNGGSVVLTARNNGAVAIANSQISTAVKGGATGAGGNIKIIGSSVFLNGTKLDASTNAAGNGGGVVISTLDRGAIELNNSTISGDTTAIGKGGDIELTAPAISLTNNSRISARTLGSGQGGSVLVNAANGTIALTDSSRISTAVDLMATGTGGDIDVLARSVSLTGGARLEALTRGLGDAGNIKITASNAITVSGANPYGLYSGLLTSSEMSNSGRGGNITINSPSQPQGTLRVADGAFLSARTLSSAAGGNIEVNVNRLELVGGGQLITSAAISGAAGSITVNATQGITVVGSNPNFSNSSSGAAPTPTGSGLINEVESNDTIAQAQNLPNRSFSLQSNPDIELATTIPHTTVNAGGNGSFDYYAFTVETPDSRGIFDIDTGNTKLDTQLFLFDQAGNLLDSNDDAPITAGAGGSTDNFNSYLNYSFIAPGTYVVGVGLYPSSGNNSGQTPISGTPLVAGNNYQLQVSIETNRNFNSNEAAASGLFAQSRGSGPAGMLTLTTPQLLMQDGAQATVSSTRSGNAGNLDINARLVTLTNSSKLAAETVSGGGGNIQLRQVEALQLNNSQISASTVDGQGGTLSVNASRSIDLNNGSGLFARASGDGTAGNLSLSTRQLTIQNRSEISTSTAGRGSAGQINAQADSLFLTSGSKITSRSTGGNAGSITLNLRDRLRANAGEISASSEQGGGGNITISARDILLRNSSLISTNVVSGSGGGGNIAITAKTIFIALEDSDILANAEDGMGGKINIQAPVFIADIFANVGQNPGKDFSRFRGNGQVDISASSRFGISGIVSIPDFTFLQNSLDRLSENFVTPEQIVAGSCLAQRNVEQGSFIVVGTGGLPDDPYGVVRSRYSLVGVQPLRGKGAGGREQGGRGQGAGSGGQGDAEIQSQIQALKSKTPAPWKPGDPIQEAQGFMQTIDGRVVLGTDAQLAEIAKAQELICGETSETPVEKHL